MLGKAFVKDPDGKLAFAVRTYVSTVVGQFLDNWIFSLIVFVGFAPIYWDGFRWSVLQCTMCALTGAAAELFMEILFSPFGYRMVNQWKRLGIGREYLAFIEKEAN